MNMIRPVSDLRNNFADISKTVHETGFFDKEWLLRYGCSEHGGV